MGAPHLGTDIARIASKFLPSHSVPDMQPWDELLQNLNRAWLQRVVNDGDPDLGLEQRGSVKCQVVFGLKDRVVPTASATAGAYLGELKAINKGHIELPKAESLHDVTYDVVKQFIRQCIEGTRTAPVRRAANVLADRARHLVLQDADSALEWTRYEEDVVTLGPLPAPEWLRCEVNSTRTGGLPSADFTICLALDGHFPDGVRIDYRFHFGRGLLTEPEYAAFGERLKNSELAPQDLDRVFGLKHLYLGVGEAPELRIHYEPHDRKYGAGFALLTYRIQPERLLGVGRTNTLHVCLWSIISRNHGWYSYRATRLVLEKLTLQLIAPFPALELGSSIWWCEPERNEDKIDNDRYSSRLEIEGPIPPGILVQWILDTESAGLSR